jgi:CubicO group peptidase (beta-lactamase class C family)
MAAAMRLWERGLLDLDAPVERYLPDFVQRGRGITVRRLAAHQSGMSDAFAVEHYTTNAAL